MKTAERVDRPIILARTSIQILLEEKSVTARAKIVLRLSPRPRVVIEFDLPRDGYDQATAYNNANQITIMHYIDVRIPTGVTIRTLVGGEWQMGGNDAWFGGMLIPTTQPVNTVSKPESINRCKFVLINFPSLRGAQDIHRPKDGSDSVSTVVQRMQLSADPWLVEMTGVDAVMGLDYRMKRLGGSAITHAGSITRMDGSDFALGELEQFLDGLHLFLSFARGSFCGLAFLSGQDSQHKTVWRQWGSREVEPWQGLLSTWVCSGESEMLSPVFEGFWKRFTDSARKETVSQVIRWYLRSNESSESAVGIILTQAALERLSLAINGPRLDMKEGDWIANALDKAGVAPQIPAQCAELTKLGQQFEWSHGPHAFVAIRNDLVHSDRRLGSVSADAYVEAWHLGQWYIELMLLHLFDYSGRYYNRLRDREGYAAAVEDVPWAATQDATQ